MAKTASDVVRCTFNFVTSQPAGKIIGSFGPIPDVTLPGNTAGAIYTVIWQLGGRSSPNIKVTAVEWGTGARASKLPEGVQTVKPGTMQLARGIWNSNDVSQNAPESFGYKIVVTATEGKGQSFTSTDPELVLSPPPG
jgi:hypothetical protein